MLAKKGREIMDSCMRTGLTYHLRTAAGFLIVIMGMAGGVWFGWWLYFRGDIIEILHDIKVSMPNWGWLVLKFTLSGALGLLFIFIVIVLGAIVLGGGRRD